MEKSRSASAEERGEIAGNGGARNFKVAKPDLEKPTLKQVGLTKQQIHEARAVRDAEKKDPGVVRRTLDKQLAEGKEPTKAAVRPHALPRTGQRLMTGAKKYCSFFGGGCPVSVANISTGMHTFVIRDMPARSDEHGLVKRTAGMLPTGKRMMGNDTGVAKTCYSNWSMPCTRLHSGCRFNDRKPAKKQ
jgi:hypothetical protein